MFQVFIEYLNGNKKEFEDMSEIKEHISGLYIKLLGPIEEVYINMSSVKSMHVIKDDE